MNIEPIGQTLAGGAMVGGFLVVVGIVLGESYWHHTFFIFGVFLASICCVVNVVLRIVHHIFWEEDGESLLDWKQKGTFNRGY